MPIPCPIEVWRFLTEQGFREGKTEERILADAREIGDSSPDIAETIRSTFTRMCFQAERKA